MSTMQNQFKGAFSGCSWCSGRGCLQCSTERDKAYKESMKPLFTADINDSQDMELMKETFGAKALEEAFSPGGGGMETIHQNAAIASLKQFLRKQSDENIKEE